MNTMELERIKHQEAQKATTGTDIEWTDLLDNTALIDRKAKQMTEEEARKFYCRYFADAVEGIKWSNEN